MNTLLPNPALSHAILIGVSDFHETDALPNLPAVRNNIADLRDSLTNPRHGILDGANCAVANNPESPREFMDRLRAVIRQTDDFLLVYYAGHGLRHPVRDDLWLTLSSTDPEALNGTAVPLDWVKEEIEHSPARTKLLVLDCCYSGLAIGRMSATIDQRELEVRGSAVLASSPRNAKSHSPVGHRYTAFTGQMVTLLNAGSPNAGEALTVTSLYRRVSVGLARDGFPKPMLAATGTTGDLLLRRTPQPEQPAEPPVQIPSVARVEPAPPPVSPLLAVEPSSVKVWVQLVGLRLLWVWTALMLVMCGSGLFGMLFGDPSTPADVDTATIGFGMMLAAGAPLFILRRRWRHLRGRTRFAQTTTGQVLLVVGIVASLALGLGAFYTDGPATSTSSVAAGRAALVLFALEGAAASGYYFYRGRRAPS
jgi:hypothetical protein